MGKVKTALIIYIYININIFGIMLNFVIFKFCGLILKCLQRKDFAMTGIFQAPLPAVLI